MLVTLKWLQDYVAIEESPEELAEMLTRQGLEVSSCEPVSPGLEGVITGRIVSLERHPNEDKLWVCCVDPGKGEITVLCGAQNLQQNDVIPLALPGTQLPSGRAIESATLHGIVSEGMLCSEHELRLSEDHEGIMRLPVETPVGQSLEQALSLDDHVLDIELTPNRPDCLCLIGIAREIAAKKGRTLRLPSSSPRGESPSINEVSSVEILAPEACPRYVARILEGIRVGPSPFWLRNRLSLVGVRPINNIVDVTNLVMLEWGQPLHAFDLDRLEGGRIVVRKARSGERLNTLDGEERELCEEDLLICDARKAVALAGVMGGQESEIHPETTRVLLESAFFEPRGIRRTAKRLGISTEASHRFEREIDKEGACRAADRAVERMLHLGGGKLLAGAIDEYPVPFEPKSIRMKVSKVNRILGTSLEKEKICNILQSLEFSLRDLDAASLEVVPPSFRPDIRQGEDLVEEVARLYGYDEIPTQMPKAPISVVLLDAEKRAEDKARDVLVGMGFHETIHYSFVGMDRLDLFADSSLTNGGGPVSLQNPLSEMQSVLRTTLVGSLLETVSGNLHQNNRDLRLFELRRVFLPSEGNLLPEEKKMLAGVIVGRRFPDGWNQAAEDADVFDLKGALEVLFDAFEMEDFKWKPSPKISCLHPGCSGDILNNTTRIGYAGKLHPAVQETLDIEEDVYLFEMEFASFVCSMDRLRSYNPIVRNPSVKRDIALVLDQEFSCGQVMEKMQEFADRRVTKMELFDLYRGPQVPEGKKSMALRVTYQDPSKTLTDEEVNKLQEVFLEELLPSFQARLR